MENSMNPCLEVEELVEEQGFGRFVCTSLVKGEGTVLGNSLRRILLSSMPGAAVSEVKIDSVYHEFSSIPGVKEDVSEIIMNLKKLAVRYTGSTEEPIMAYIDYMGEGTVKASDIKVSSEIEVLNPDLVIATLSGEDAKLYMELTITRGRGYDGANTRDHSDLAIGVIAVDAIYSPVKKVNVRIEEQGEEEKLILDVETDKTLAPKEAVSLAARVLQTHLKLFIDMDGSAKESAGAGSTEEQKSDELNKSIDELELSVRSYNCLKRAGINTVEDLCAKSMDDLMKVRNMGRKSLDEILNKLEGMGLHLSVKAE
ncbi:MAG: DNA-directed RNA polymerase subunit alpha [Lachnospiraceae bacterium]|nr:DNA-directed RNA polymerase subunit alpha [Lachnospiraceae bacterium]